MDSSKFRCPTYCAANILSQVFVMVRKFWHRGGGERDSRFRIIPRRTPWYCYTIFFCLFLCKKCSRRVSIFAVHATAWHGTRGHSKFAHRKIFYHGHHFLDGGWNIPCRHFGTFRIFANEESLICLVAARKTAAKFGPNWPIGIPWVLYLRKFVLNFWGFQWGICVLFFFQSAAGVIVGVFLAEHQIQ